MMEEGMVMEVMVMVGGDGNGCEGGGGGVDGDGGGKWHS